MDTETSADQAKTKSGFNAIRFDFLKSLQQGMQLKPTLRKKPSFTTESSDMTEKMQNAIIKRSNVMRYSSSESESLQSDELWLED